MGKLLGAANMILSVIPDTVEIVGKITDKTAPIVDKHLDRKHQYKQSLVGVPSAYEEFVSIRNRFKNFAVILYI